MPRTVLTPPAGGSPHPLDIPKLGPGTNTANRVGFWRILKVFDEFKIPGVLAINGSALAAYPPIVEAAMSRNWEFMGPRLHAAQHAEGGRNEREDIPQDRRRNRPRRPASGRAAGSGPWPHRDLGYGRTCSKRRGYDYVADWGAGTTSRSGSGPPPRRSSTWPYTQGMQTTSAMMLIQHHKASEYYDRAIDQFEQILRWTRRIPPEIMALVFASLHHGCARTV